MKIRLLNGNDQHYTVTVPQVIILDDFINDVALQHIRDNTGIQFKKAPGGYYIGDPKSTHQIVKLFLTYDFKTQYHNNLTNKNTLFLKSCYDDGFKVRTVCYQCCKDNNIRVKDLNPEYKLIVSG